MIEQLDAVSGILCGDQIRHLQRLHHPRRHILVNHLEKKIDIVTGDLKEADRFFDAASFDVITCNPPYMK